MRARLIILALAIGCGRDAAPAARTFTPATFDTLWVRGGIADTILEIPLHLAADAEFVYVTDASRAGVAALRIADGTTAWTSGGKGSGPGEFLRPIAIEILPDGRLAVLDTDNARLGFLDRHGKWLGHAALEEAQAAGICGLADGSIVLSLTTTGQSIARIDTTGHVLGRADLPWKFLTEESSLLHQGMLRHTPGRDGCVLALFFGPGFAVFDGASWKTTTDYIEQVLRPEVRQREGRNGDTNIRTQSISGSTISSRALAVGGGRIWLQFDGETQHRGHIIDVYDMSGRYLESLRMAARVNGLALSDDTLLVLSQVDGIPLLTALRRRP